MSRIFGGSVDHVKGWGIIRPDMSVKHEFRGDMTQPMVLAMGAGRCCALVLDLLSVDLCCGIR